jgi:hypothetical protein
MRHGSSTVYEARTAVTDRTVPAIGKSARIAALALLAMSCATDGPCVIPPCALSVAATITVTSSVSSAKLTDATMHAQGSGGVTDGPCTGGLCYVFGGADTYQVEVSAPGFTTAHLTFTVTGSPGPKCGCGSTNTQQLSVALVPAP